MVHRALVLLGEAVQRSSRLRPRRAALELTDSAATRIKQLLEQRHKVGTRGSDDADMIRTGCPSHALRCGGAPVNRTCGADSSM